MRRQSTYSVVRMTDLVRPIADAPAAPRRPLVAVFAVLLRISATLHALLAVSQPVSIGQYLSGVYAWLGVHSTGAGLLILAAMALGVVSIGYAIAARRVWVALVGPLFFFADGFQTGMGYSRTLSVHVPLGVAIVAGSLLFAGWTWRSRR